MPYPSHFFPISYTVPCVGCADMAVVLISVGCRNYSAGGTIASPRLRRQKINLKLCRKYYIITWRFNDMAEEVILEGRA
jgi:hypothetical protein